MSTGKHILIKDIDEHYALKHRIRKGMYNKPYANFGYWPRPGMTIDEACDAMAGLMGSELDVKAEDIVLECGCGYGTSAFYIMEKYGPQKIIGLDVTSIRIESGQKSVVERGLEGRVEIDFGDATKLDFDDNTFTKIMAIECAFHFDTRYDFFVEAYRTLKPGGTMALADIILSSSINPSEYTPDELRDFLSADKKRYCDANLYNAQTYRELLAKAGFDGINIYSIKDSVVLQYADHVEKTIANAPAEERERRTIGVNALREKFMKGGDYVVVTARKNA